MLAHEQPSAPPYIAILGGGTHGLRSHYNHLLDMPELGTVIAIADIYPERAQSEIDKVIADHSAKDDQKPSRPAVVTEWQDVIRDETIDAVMIMTPDRFHVPQLMGAVAAGKHVFCEKPLASTRDEYTELQRGLRIAAATGLVVSTCHPRRFDPPCILTKRFLREPKLLQEFFGIDGKLGEPEDLEFTLDYCKLTKFGLHASLLTDHLGHENDWANDTCGISKVTHITKHLANQTSFYVTGEREDGITFSFAGFRNNPKPNYYRESLRVACSENSSIEMDMKSGECTVQIGDETRTIQDERFKTDYNTRFDAINRNFLKAVLGIEPSYITDREMLLNTELAIKIG